MPLCGRDSKLVGTNVQGIICLVVRSNVSKFVYDTVSENGKGSVKFETEEE